MTNGNDVVEFEEENCEKLQEEYAEMKGIDIDQYDFIMDNEYWSFVIDHYEFIMDDEYWSLIERKIAEDMAEWRKRWEDERAK